MTENKKNINLFSTFKEKSASLNSLRLVKSSIEKIGLMILFDAMFVVSFLGLKTLLEYFAQGIFLVPSTASIVTYVSLSLLYVLLVILFYSFFKYSVLNFIKSLEDESGKAKFSLERFFAFYGLNIMIAGIFFAIMLAFNFLLAGMRQDYAPYIFILLVIPYSLILYIVVNISHTRFYIGASIKESLKYGFALTWDKLKKYAEVLFFIILIPALLGVLIFALDYLLRRYSYNFYVMNFDYIRQSYLILLDLIVYIIILVNRISFYTIGKNQLRQGG